MLKGILVGLGGRGQSWINVCGRSSTAKLVGFVEPVQAQRERVSEKFKLPATAVHESLDKAIRAHGDADFVLDITPPAIHERVALEAFEAGLHVLGEKPMSDDFDAAKRMVAASRAAGKRHMVAQNYRFGPLPRTTQRILQTGVIGNPESASVGFYRAWANAPGSHYVTMPYPLLTDMGIHHFDLLRYVLGREPVRVSTQTHNPSWGWHAGDAGHTAVIEFEGGLIATHHALGCSVGKQSPWNGDWRVDGPQGSLSWEEDRLFVTRVAPAESPVREEIPMDELAHNGQDAVLAEFAAAIEQGRDPECSGLDNLHSLALVFAAVQSAKEGRTVEIAELLCEHADQQSA